MTNESLQAYIAQAIKQAESNAAKSLSTGDQQHFHYHIGRRDALLDLQLHLTSHTGA